MISAIVVDDQVAVVSSILSGVRWEKIGITKVYKAYNAFEAKEFIASKKIDVMLCDIEMPGENGLSLLRWIRENDYSVECVFLSSHPEFHYAKEAIVLGGFDYIVQPARHDDVEAVLKKAVEKVLWQTKSETYYKYGQLVEAEQGVLNDLFITKLLKSDRVDLLQLKGVFEKLNVKINLENIFYFALLGLKKEGEAFSTDEGLYRYGLDNILSELAQRYGLTLLLLKYSENTYIMFLYKEDGATIDFESYYALLQNCVAVCDKIYKTKLAIYTDDAIKPENISNSLKGLLARKQNDVFTQMGVHLNNEMVSFADVTIHEIPSYRWKVYGDAESFLLAKREIMEWIADVEEKQMLTMKELQLFHQNFVQLLFRILEQKEISLQAFIPNSALRAEVLEEYQSTEQIKKVLEIVSEHLEQDASKALSTENPVECIINYVCKNVEKDIRRADIAQAMHLSPDYISHLFKDEMKIPLSEFITQQKMNLAKSLLLTTKLPVGIVAAKVGYTNFSHFSKTYKEIYGCTPAAQRKLEQNK